MGIICFIIKLFLIIHFFRNQSFLIDNYKKLFKLFLKDKIISNMFLYLNNYEII